jgi:hypothetical protein
MYDILITVIHIYVMDSQESYGSDWVVTLIYKIDDTCVQAIKIRVMSMIFFMLSRFYEQSYI